MTIKPVFRFDSRWPKLRLFRVIWDGRSREFMSGTPHATLVQASRKLAVSLRPCLFRFGRDEDGCRIVVAGIELHSATSWGGRFV